MSADPKWIMLARWGLVAMPLSLALAGVGGAIVTGFQQNLPTGLAALVFFLLVGLAVAVRFTE
jgi:hypothetical protein